MYGMDNEDDTVTLQTIIIQTQLVTVEEGRRGRGSSTTRTRGHRYVRCTIEFEDNVASLPSPVLFPSQSIVPDRSEASDELKHATHHSLNLT